MLLKHSLDNLGKDEVIKQFGLPRSGTNYVRFLIESNYSATVNVDKEGWKHGYVIPALGKNRKCVLVCKNPFSWICSVFKYYKEPRKDDIIKVSTSSLEKFIESNIILGNLGIFFSFKNPIECWNLMHRHWLSIPYTGRSLCILKHEDLLSNAEKSMGLMAGIFGISRKSRSFITTEKTFNPAGDIRLRISKKEFKKNYYSNSEYMENFSQKMIDNVMNSLDMEIFEKLGYST